jgi:hypothetical protein
MGRGDAGARGPDRVPEFADNTVRVVRPQPKVGSPRRRADQHRAEERELHGPGDRKGRPQLPVAGGTLGLESRSSSGMSKQ